MVLGEEGRSTLLVLTEVGDGLQGTPCFGRGQLLVTVSWIQVFIFEPESVRGPCFRQTRGQTTRGTEPEGVSKQVHLGKHVKQNCRNRYLTRVLVRLTGVCVGRIKGVRTHGTQESGVDSRPRRLPHW